ncbi:MAG: SDR family oxidoreductase [Sulfitobacter sp.]
MKKTLLSFGHGFSARALAARLIPQGWHIIGTTRSAEKCAAIAATGVEPIVWPGTDVSALLTEIPHLLVSAGPGPQGDPVLDLLRDDIARAASSLRWVGYLSTTGVYGDHQGGWVDETTPLTPATKRGKARVEAEAAWQAIENLPLHIFRLAGIYGPGRGPFAKVRKGTARRIIKEGQVFSRIHVEDIALALELSINAPQKSAIYNLCDDDPAPPQDVIGHAAELLGMPLPPAIPYDQAEMTPMARSFYAESKKVSNQHAKRALGWDPLFPNYRAGLAALLRDEER